MVLLCCSDATCSRKEILQADIITIGKQREAIMNGECVDFSKLEEENIQSLIKGGNEYGKKFIMYADELDENKVKNVFIIYRHAKTPSSNYINESHSSTEITVEGRMFSDIFGKALYHCIPHDQKVLFLSGDTKRNIETQNNVFASYVCGKELSLDAVKKVHKSINELQLGLYEKQEKHEVLCNADFLSTITDLGTINGTEKSVARSVLEFCNALCVAVDKCKNTMTFVCSNSAFMAAVVKFAGGFENLIVPNNLAFFVLVPCYEENMFYILSPELTFKFFPGLSFTIQEQFETQILCTIQTTVYDYLTQKVSDEELAKSVACDVSHSVYDKMFKQNHLKIFHITKNIPYISLGKQLSKETVKEIKKMLCPAN